MAASVDELVELLCETMHDAYEEAAAGNGWVTNPASRRPWSDVPDANRATMRVAVRALLTKLDELIARAAEIENDTLAAAADHIDRLIGVLRMPGSASGPARCSATTPRCHDRLG